MTRLLLLSLTLFLSACATPYEEAPCMGGFGYGLEPTPGNLTKVYFSGNCSTSSEQAKKYVLRRAAEIGKQRDEKYFAAYGSLLDAANDIKTGPAVCMVFNRPNAYAYILYSNHKIPDYFVIDKVLNTP